MNWTPMTTILTPGKLGVASIKHITVGREASFFTALRPGEYVPEGAYAQLHVGSTLMMSDTSMEKTTNREVLRYSRGEVLIAGLGLGMILVPILAKPEVTKVLVLEKYQDVIDLVLPQLQAKLPPEHFAKLTVQCCDVLEWLPPKGLTWDTIYFDIWPNKCTDNLEEITLLKRRYARRLRPGGWKGAWVEGELRARKRRDDQERSRWRW